MQFMKSSDSILWRIKAFVDVILHIRLKLSHDGGNEFMQNMCVWLMKSFETNAYAARNNFPAW